MSTERSFQYRGRGPWRNDSRLDYEPWWLIALFDITFGGLFLFGIAMMCWQLAGWLINV